MLIKQLPKLRNELHLNILIWWFLKLIYPIILLITLFTNNLLAQSTVEYLDVKKYAIGVYGATGLNNHSVDFAKLIGTPNCCSGFESGSGIGLNIGMILQYPLTQEIELDIRASVLDLGADLISTQQIPISNLDNSNDGDIAVIEHLISSNISTVGLNLGVNYYPLQYLYLHGGAFLGYNISGVFEQEERLISPSNRGVFRETGTRKRNELHGDIPELNSLNSFLNFGVGYSLLLNERGTFLLVPEVSFNLGLNNINSQPWKVNQITFGLALMFNSLSREYDNPINPVR